MRALASAAVIVCLVSASACELPPPGPAPGASPLYPGNDEVQREYLRLRQRASARLLEQKRRVERVGRRLLETIPDHPRVQFVIAQGHPEVNAGATFGQVAVTSGMLDFVKSDDEMAVVLGHELAHITQGHVTKGMLGGLALNILAIVIESRAPGAGRAAGGIGQLFLNHYTQTQEREADTVGLRYAYGAGYDPRAAVDVQERLAVEAPQTLTAGYFDTHPSSAERAVAAKKLSEELLAAGPPPGREAVLAMEREDQARFRSDRRPEPVSAEPRSLRASEDKDEEKVVRSSEPGPETPQYEASEGDCRRAESYVRRAQDAADAEQKEQLLRRALRFCPSLAGAHAGLGELLRSRGDEAGAEREFRRARELERGDAAAHHEPEVY